MTVSTDQIPIHNTLSCQEKFVLFFTSLLFVLQPYDEFVDQRPAVFVLCAIGVWILIFQNSIYKRTGFWQYMLIMVLLGMPGIISLCNTHDLGQTAKFALGFPVFFAAGTTMYSLLCNRRAVRVLTTLIAVTSVYC